VLINLSTPLKITAGLNSSENCPDVLISGIWDILLCLSLVLLWGS
jgi:hypothetical protein